MWFSFASIENLNFALNYESKHKKTKTNLKRYKTGTLFVKIILESESVHFKTSIDMKTGNIHDSYA